MPCGVQAWHGSQSRSSCTEYNRSATCTWCALRAAASGLQHRGGNGHWLREGVLKRDLQGLQWSKVRFALCLVQAENGDIQLPALLLCFPFLPSVGSSRSRWSSAGFPRLELTFLSSAQSHTDNTCAGAPLMQTFFLNELW